MSTAQDYRKGVGGFQQQPWLASLGGEACVWTNHPGGNEKSSGRPSFWGGNGIQPRVAQHKNIVIAIYKVPVDNPFPYSHAYLPPGAFDEFREDSGWLIARRGDGYVALTARPRPVAGQNPAEWISRSPESAWICLLGRKADDGSFTAFTARVRKAKIDYDNPTLVYRDAAGLSASFGWDSPLRINEKAIPIDGYPRFQSPFVNAARGRFFFRVAAGGLAHEIDFRAFESIPLHASPARQGN